MAKITRSPVGLLDFFGLKNDGRNPAELANVVAPIIDLREFYLADRWQYTSESGLTATGTNNVACALSVPVGEIWYVKEFGVSSGALGAGVQLRLQAFITLPGNVARSQITAELDQAASGVAGEVVRTAVRDVLCTGGTEFGFTSLQNVGGPVGGLAAKWVYARFLR